MRPSSISKLMECPAKAVLSDDTLGTAREGADVGTVVHAAVEKFHHTLSSEEALVAMRNALATFPTMSAAGRTKAEKITAAYIADPAHQIKLTHIEVPVRLDLGDGVVIRGTLDQIRDNRVWDLKTTTWCTAEEGRAEYQWQQAAYVLAARQTLGIDVVPGGLLWAASYLEKRPRIFIEMGLTLDECQTMMSYVKQTVLDIRAGRVEARPGVGACKWCEQPKFPQCLRLLKRRLR